MPKARRRWSGRPRKPRVKPLKVVARIVLRMFQGLALFGLALLALTLGWLRSEDFQRLATERAEEILEGALGEPATLTHVQVLLAPPAISVEGFHVHSRASGDTILSAERVYAPIALGLTGPRIGQLRLDRPTVHVHLDERGQLVEFQDRKRTGKALQRLPWNSLRVTDGDLLLEHPSATVHLTGLTVVPGRGAVADVSGRLDVTLLGPPADGADRRQLTESYDISWPGLEIGPTMIRVPALSLDGRALDITGAATWPLGGAMDVKLDGVLAIDEVNALFAPPMAGHGELRFAVALSGRPNDPMAKISARGEGLALDMPGKFTPVLHYDLDTIIVDATARKTGIDLDRVLAPWAGGQIVATGHITPDKRLEHSHVQATDVTLAPLLRAFGAAPNPWVDLVGNGDIDWSGTLAPLRLEGTFDVGVQDLHVADRPIDKASADDLLLDIPFGHANGTILLEREHVLLDCASVKSPRNEGSARIDIGLLARGPLDLRFKLDQADLSDFAPLGDVNLQGRGRIEGIIQGPFNDLELVGAGDVRDFEVLGIHYADRLTTGLHSPKMKSLELVDAVATLKSTNYGGRYSLDFSKKDPATMRTVDGQPPRSTLTMSTAVEVTRGRVEDLVQMFVDLQGLRGDLAGTLTLDGPLFDLSGESHLSLANAEVYGERFPSGEAHGFMDRGVFTLDDLRLRRDGGAAGLTLRGTVEREWKLDMELVADGFELAKLDRLASTGTKVSGRLGGIARITNTLYDPSPDGRIWLADLRYANRPAGDSLVQFDSEGGVARFHGKVLGGTAAVEGTLGLWGEQPYAMTARLDGVPAHLLYPTAADGTPVTARASGDLELSGHFGPQWGPVALRANLGDVDVQYAAHHLENAAPWVFALDGDTFDIEGFDLRGGKTRLQLTGSGPSPMDLRGGGAIDLDLLRAVVPGLQKSVGEATVAITATGTRPAVKARVDVDVSAELFRHESAPLSFEGSNAHFVVTEDRIDVTQLAGNVGGGTFKGGGHVDSEGWWPKRWDLSMTVNDASVKWVEYMPPAVGNGSFRFDGPAGSALLSGDVDITEMVWSDRIDWEDSLVEFRSWMLVDAATSSSEPPLFAFDVGIRADEAITVRNNLAEAAASASLRVTGDTNRPGLVGTVTLQDGGLAYLQDREFRIARGNFLFDDPWTWDPQLDFLLVTDITSKDQNYTVQYQVGGPFSNWHTTTRSEPWLPQADVNALLWFGATLEELQEMGALPRALALGVGDLLVTDLFVSGQAGVSQNLPDFFPDRIDLATGVDARGQYSPDPRLVLEKRIDTLGGVDLTWEVNVARPQDNYATAKVRIGGLWSVSAWYATLQRDRVLPIGGAYGADLLVRWEFE